MQSQPRPKPFRKPADFFSILLEARSDTIKLPHETLSNRESQVFQLLVVGKGLTEIAEGLKLNVTTVSTYRARILEKTNIKTNADLVRYAMHHNLAQ